MTNNLDRYIEVARRLSQDGELTWWGGLDKELMNYKKALEFLWGIPDDMDYPNDEAFRVALNKWWHEEVKPFLKEVEDENIST